ncbi:heterokaryon incompatibility protein-domain-containing protein [Cercophora scortea]|uniref:Heterokaryon incompatibility protein-domain-containing protein n=1 Tax=Cercophora scortea TaxID=314031 RepID=A0AAE0M494_9PEZI|nr:heterokaryon incompatibility protein-domain-containing protein [Cercophora scortea]
MASTSYEYSPLTASQIRLLTLEPGSGDAPLQGSLSVVSLNAASFEALSYVWGSGEKPCQILTPSGALPMTKSLHSFLLRLRLDDRPRVLWADGLCINQADDVEKGSQVMLMPEIYSKANTVLVDLGEATHDSDLALDLLDKHWRQGIWKGAQLGLAGGQTLAPEVFAFYLGIDLARVEPFEGELPEKGDAIWDACTNFWDRAWFLRVWVVQEFILAQNPVMHVGSRTVDWRHLFAATCAYGDATGLPWRMDGSSEASHRGMMVYICVVTIRQVRRLQQSQEGRDFLQRDSYGPLWYKFSTCRFIEVLHYFQFCEATLDRDRYYALLAVSQDVTMQTGVVVDYVCSSSTVVKRFARLLIIRPYGHELLLRAGLWQLWHDDIPSWTQDLAGPRKNTSFVVDLHPRLDDTISVRGKMIDVLATSHKPGTNSRPQEPGQITLQDWLQYLAEGVDDLLRGYPNTTYHPTGEDPLDAACMTLLARSGDAFTTDKKLLMAFYTMLWHGLVPPDILARKPAYLLVLLKRFRGTIDEWRQGLKDITREIIWPFIQPLRPARTKRGYFANLPPCFEAGDEVWIVSGCQLPLLLRRSGERTGMLSVLEANNLENIRGLGKDEGSAFRGKQQKRQDKWNPLNELEA